MCVRVPDSRRTLVFPEAISEFPGMTVHLRLISRTGGVSQEPGQEQSQEQRGMVCTYAQIHMDPIWKQRSS